MCHNAQARLNAAPAESLRSDREGAALRRLLTGILSSESRLTSYLDMSGFSRKGLIGQLSSSAGEGFSRADATFAVDHVDVNWNDEAVESAQSYLDMSSFSRQGLIDQLSSSAGEGFTWPRRSTRWTRSTRSQLWVCTAGRHWTRIASMRSNSPTSRLFLTVPGPVDLGSADGERGLHPPHVSCMPRFGRGPAGRQLGLAAQLFEQPGPLDQLLSLREVHRSASRSASEDEDDQQDDDQN